ncbi:reticulophagy regulator 2-like isoform X2 [Rhopilema esculentum]|uniref:reticulophagy regulator 2-like isoform X2 n=1 Tax=Rhopilema esculentum TaxID=499914 RepID=UPI0031D3FC87
MNMSMLSRLKGFFRNIKGKVKEVDDEKEPSKGVPPEDEIASAEVQNRRSKVAEFLEPVNKNWEFIEEVLLWKNAMPACVCFFLISGVFWKFINAKLRKIVLALGAFLLANGLSSDLRASSWEFFETNFHFQTRGEPKLQFSFDELCLFIATGWAMFAQAHESLRNMSTTCPPKFYCIVAVSLFTILALFTYIPVLELIYVLVCLLFFYPSMNYYGIMDKIEARVQRLTNPIVRHWENNRTKRSRVITQPGNQEQTDDSEDEFTLERNQFTKKVLSSAVPDAAAESESDEELLTKHLPVHDGEYFTESQFEENLAMPSMSNFDSMMEPYEDFHAGLKFPDYEDSSTVKTFNVLAAAANNFDTDDEIDDLPYDNDKIALHKDEVSDPAIMTMSRPVGDNESQLRKRRVERDSKHGPIPHETYDASDFSSEECTRAVEADFEFLEHADVDDLNFQPENNVVENKATGSSYTDSGIASVSKWLGYE